MEKQNIRKATSEDIAAIAAIYEEIHTTEEKGLAQIGWQRGVYPTQKTAEDALQRGDLLVFEEDGRICASAIVNQKQLESYAQGHWNVKATDDDVMVLHTLTVSPSCRGKGIGRKFVAFYEKHAVKNHCRALRIDTQAKNVAARHLYAKLGFHEAGIIDCPFNGLSHIQLVLLEKDLSNKF